MPEPEDNEDGKVVDGTGDGGGDTVDGGKGDGDLITIINSDDFTTDDKDDKGKGKKGDADDKDGTGDRKSGKGDADGKGKKPDPKKSDDDPEKAELIRKNKDLNRALHELRQEKKKEKKEDDGETVLTDAQLEALMTEYKDDPKTLLNIIKYQAERAAKGAAKKTVDDADTIKKKREAEEYVYKNYPDLTQEDSELRVSVNKAKESLDLTDHPYGELLGTSVTALMALPTLLKNAYDKGRKDVEDGVKEKTRKDLIKDGDLTPKGKKGGETGKALSADQSDVAKRLGLNTPRQQALLKKFTASKGARTVSVED